jgi:hypothetical protein
LHNAIESPCFPLYEKGSKGDWIYRGLKPLLQKIVNRWTVSLRVSEINLKSEARNSKQIQNPKSQIPNKFQITNHNFKTNTEYLERPYLPLTLTLSPLCGERDLIYPRGIVFI